MGVVSSLVANKDASCWTNFVGTGVARANYHGKEDCELSFQTGDEFLVTAKTADWFRAKNKRTNESGLCPISYLTVTANEEHHQRESHKDLLSELDHMFEETISAADAERKEDEEALKAAAALEAEFSFDNIMAEVMAMKGDNASSDSPTNATGAGAARPTVGPKELELSFDTDRYSSEIEDDGTEDLPVPKKPLPPPPPAPVADDDEPEIQQPPPPLAISSSPRSVRRNLPTPSASPTTALGASAPILSVQQQPSSSQQQQQLTQQQQMLQQRRSATPATTSAMTAPLIPAQPKSATSSPNVSRVQAASRPIAKLLGEDGQTRCAKCSTVISKDATFCKHCGSTLKNAVAEQCSKCKLILKPGTSACGSCGTRTSEASSSKTPASPSRSNARPPEGDAFLSASSPNLSFKSLSPRRNTDDFKGLATPTSPRRVLGEDQKPATPIIGSPRRLSNVNKEAVAAAAAVVQIPTAAAAAAAAADDVPLDKTRCILVGSGSSGGTPSLNCLAKDRCKACVDALQPGSRNRRRNPSLLIQHRGKNILIDCGKSFREGWIEVIEKYHVKEVHAVIITHAHADAFYGLDDLREVIGKGGAAVPVYARESDLAVIEATFPYLTSKGKEGSQRFVANITFNALPNSGPFVVCGLKFRAVPLPHGDCTALGFQFGPVVYFSDCSAIPDRVFEFLSKLPNFKVLIIDALFVKTECFHHLNLPQALLAIQQAKPERAILTGCSHEFYYQDIRRVLKKVCVREKISVKMGYDLLNFSLEASLFD